MRMIMMIAALMLAAQCFASDDDPPEIQPPRYKTSRRVKSPMRLVFTRIIPAGVEGPGCMIEVNVRVDGCELRYVGDNRTGVGSGDLKLAQECRDGSNLHAPVLGTFSAVGTGKAGYFIEWADGMSNAQLTILQETNNRSGVHPTTPIALPTNGHALQEYGRDLRTLNLQPELLTVMFNSAAQTAAVMKSQDPSYRIEDAANEFLFRLTQSTQSPRDVRVEKSICAPGQRCGADGVVVPGLPVATPYGYGVELVPGWN